MAIGVASVKLIYVVVVSYTVKIVPLCQMIGARPSATIYMVYMILKYVTIATRHSLYLIYKVYTSKPSN